MNEEELNERFRTGTIQEKLKVLDQLYDEILRQRVGLDNIESKIGSDSMVMTLEQGVFEDDREYYKRSPVIWTPVKSLKFNNVSKLLAKSFQNPINYEIGFMGDFHHEGDGKYNIRVLGETLGLERYADIWEAAERTDPRFQDNPEKLLEFLNNNRKIGFGHTHPKKKYIPSGSDMEKLVTSLFYRPHVVINPACDAVVYFPLKGFYFVEKSNMSVESMNADKKVPKVI
jgi:proteasome lid subunit RPN8/RPN11